MDAVSVSIRQRIHHSQRRADPVIGTLRETNQTEIIQRREREREKRGEEREKDREREERERRRRKREKEGGEDMTDPQQR